MSDKKRILIVEDDRTSQNILQRLLDKEGYDVTVAGNGRIAIAETERVQPDMLLLDILMPEVTGVEYLRWLKGKYPHIPVILLTNIDDTSELADEARQLGVFDYFKKPPDFGKLILRIQECLA